MPLLPAVCGVNSVVMNTQCSQEALGDYLDKVKKETLRCKGVSLPGK